MSFTALASSQTDARSPVDEQLMDTIRTNLDDLDARILASGVFDYQFKVNGRLRYISTRNKLRMDGVLVSKAATFQACKAYLEEPGDGGTLEIDVRRYTKPDVLITALTRQFSASINSIARTGSAVNTQSVTRSTAQISTQTITQWKSSLNITSIVPIGDDLVRYNFSSAPDSDWVVGDSVTFSSCSNALNDGAFTIVRVKDDGGNNIVVTNASGVEQSGTAGAGRLDAWSYNFTNPVSTEFAAGQAATFASHSTGANNGSLTIYAINQSGNNIIVKNASGATQGGAAGTVDVLRWIFAFSASAPSDYAVNEKAHMTGHTSGGNDGEFLITAINQGGNNVIVYNTAGVVQGGVAGTVETNRWTYFFSSNPSTDVSVGYSVIAASTSSAVNSGTFTVVQVNRSTNDNIVIYNLAGTAQGGSAGTLITKRILVKFASDQSATITTDSKITIYGTASESADGDFAVVEVNRGGGSNFNAIIENSDAAVQVGPAGRVVFESKSLFTTKPSFTIPERDTNFVGTHGQVSTNAVFHATRKTVDAGTLIMMDITNIPDGDAKNLTVQLL